MPTLPFFKYQGTGNDFVIIDNREAIFDRHNAPGITRLCDRKFGIGADGLILIEPHTPHDFEMVYFNADATRASCGNGARCTVHLARHLGIVDDTASFVMEGDTYQASLQSDHVRLRMVDVSTVEEHPDGYLLDTGTRHFVRFMEGLAEHPVVEEGRAVRYEERFQPVGANVSFTEEVNQEVHMRIYEKGVENETLSSGTGATAVALAWATARQRPSPIAVHTTGGVLTISFEQTEDGTFTQVYMAGPAQMVFQGTVFV